MPSLLSKPFRFIAEQWRLIDAEYLGTPAADAGAADGDGDARGTGQGKKGKRGKGGGAPATTGADQVPPATRYRRSVIMVLVTVMIALTLQEYFGHRVTFQKLFPYDGGEYWTLQGFGWWSGWRVFGYILLPVIAILLTPGERLRDYYIGLQGLFRHLWIYLALYLLVLPAVLVAARMDSFSATYPFYKLANRSSFDFWVWEFLYALQFLALEFFFRGFMLRGLGRAIGANAIFVMCVPYCMIHYGKPLPETLGSIFAGIALGTLAMRTKSIWGGVFIHVGVALTMDALALGNCPPAETGRPCGGH